MQEEVEKLSFARLRRPLEQLVGVALPMHAAQLRNAADALEATGGGRAEQAHAAKAMQLLKADLHQLEQLNRQVREEDQDAFHKQVHLPLKNAEDTLILFMEQHSDALGPLVSDQPQQPLLPPIVCDSSAPTDLPDEKEQLQLEQEPPRPQTGAWSLLRTELLEIHSLVHRFAAMVLSQQEGIDTVQANVEKSGENVRLGTEHLSRAAALRTAALPLAGALVGGLLLGPVGALAGLKMAGAMACAAGGTAIGYTAGRKLKSRNQAALLAITYPLARTRSEPELSSAEKG